MTSDIEWTNELLHIAENKSYQELLDWIGTTLENLNDSNIHSTYILKPFNDRISKAFVNINDNKLERVYLQGDTFFLPFEYLLGETKEYKTTFNTYDAIDDEQFIFYPTKLARQLIGIDSWIDKGQQSLSHKEINFKNVSFYFDQAKVPIHYRDGWHFANPLKA
jgi:retron-type reverse transcriptase